MNNKQEIENPEESRPEETQPGIENAGTPDRKSGGWFGSRKALIAIVVVLAGLSIAGYFIYSGARHVTPIDLNNSFSSLPSNTSTVIYVNNLDQWLGNGGEAAAPATPAAPAVEVDDPGVTYTDSGTPVSDITLLDQIRSIREVDQILVAVPRGFAMPTVVIAPFQEPELLMAKMRELPGFASSRGVDVTNANQPVLQVRFVYQKLFYLSAAENKYLFIGDGKYFFDSMRGFSRLDPKTSFAGTTIGPLLTPYSDSTLFSIVQVISFPDELDTRIEEMRLKNDEHSIALLQRIDEMRASLENLNALRLDVGREGPDNSLAVEASLLFASPELAAQFRDNVDQARALTSAVVGIVLPRKADIAFNDLMRSFQITPRAASPQVVVLDFESTPERVRAFAAALSGWVKDQVGPINRLAPEPKPETPEEQID